MPAMRQERSLLESACRIAMQTCPFRNRIVIPTEAYLDFLLHGSHQRPRMRLSVKRAA
jgi:hypothetical protein